MVRADPAKLLRGLSSNNKLAICEMGNRIREFIGKTAFLDEYDFAILAKTIEQFNTKRRLGLAFDARDDAIRWEVHLKALLNDVSEFEVELRAKDAEENIGKLIDEISELEVGSLPFGYATLSAEEKQSIRRKLEQVKATIDSSKLSTRKKNALYERISKLLEEVDREGTRTDGFFSFAVDLAMTATEMTEKAKPAIEQFKDVLRIIFSRRAEAEGVQLPRPEDNPMLFGPKDE